MWYVVLEIYLRLIKKKKDSMETNIDIKGRKSSVEILT